MQFPKPNLREASPAQRVWWHSHQKYQPDSGSIFPYTCLLCGETYPPGALRYIPTGVMSAYGPSGDPICEACYRNPPQKEKRKRKKRDLDD
jgi:hypothetical protein